MNIGPKVFVVQENHRINYSHAEKYGEVVFLSVSDFKPLPTTGLINQVVVDGIRKLLEDNFDSKQDFILLTGSPMNILITGAMLLKFKGEIKVLKWNNQDKRYDTCLFINR